MYSARLGYENAIKRINRLIENKHYSEAFVVTVFTIEKTLRRTLNQLIVSSGFSTEISKKILAKIKGIEYIKENWIFYDPKHRRLLDIIGDDNWSKIKRYSEMRNEFVHGIKVYNLKTCKEATEELLSILDEMKKKLKDTYGFDGWERLAVRNKSCLHNDPKV